MFNQQKLYQKENKKYCHVLGDLDFIKMTVKYFFINKKASILTHSAHISLMTWTLLEVIYFIIFPSAQFLWDFGFSFFALAYIFTMISVHYIQEADMDAMDSFMEKHFWNLRCCGSALYETLSKRARVGKIFGWIQLIIAATNGFLFLPHESDRSKLFFVLAFLKKYHNNFYQYYRYIFFMFLTWTTTIVITQMNIYFYYIIHLDFQYQLLTKHIENIETDFADGLLSTSYDEEIGRRLAVCVEHSQKLTEFRQRFLDLLYYSFLFLLWLGLGVSMFIAYHLLVIKNGEDILALSFLWISVAECTIQLSLVGQHYVDVAEELFFTLTRCLWYNWSNSNKKSFLLFLVCAQNFKIILVGGTIPYNMSLAVWMGNKTVKALTFFRAVRRKDNISS